MRWARNMILALSLIGLAWNVGCGGGSSKERFSARVTYVLEPSQKLPEGLQSVAVLDTGIDAAQELTENTNLEVRWSTIAADMAESLIQDSSVRFSAPLSVQKRRETRRVLEEHDLIAAGLVDQTQASQIGKLLPVQGLIASKMNIVLDVKTSKKTTVDMMSMVGAMVSQSPGSIRTKEVQEVQRNLSVQCSFSLLDAMTGENIFQYSSPAFAKYDKESPNMFMGGNKDESDLEPIDPYIGELVEQGTREFVSMFIPCEVAYTYEVESSRQADSAKGVRLMRMDDYATALEFFKAAIAEKPDDHRTLFAMGVTSEMIGDWDGALKYYRMAAGAKGPDEEELAKYIAAKDRVARHKERIRKPG